MINETIFDTATQYRKELKFVINKQELIVISRRLSLLCNYDINAPTNGIYTVSSLYFDDYRNSAYNDKLSGVINRKKYRIRIYNGSDKKINLERKIKNSDVCKKDSTQISRFEYEKILKGSFDIFNDTNDPIKSEFQMLLKTKRLQPKVVVIYDRQAYTYEYGNVRIVFDSRLRTNFFLLDLFKQDLSINIVETNQVILEIKYSGFLPQIIKDTIQHSYGNMQAISKYIKCMQYHINQK